MSTAVTVTLLVLLIAALVWFAIDIGKHLDAHSREIAALQQEGVQERTDIRAVRRDVAGLGKAVESLKAAEGYGRHVGKP